MKPIKSLLVSAFVLLACLPLYAQWNGVNTEVEILRKRIIRNRLTLVHPTVMEAVATSGSVPISLGMFINLLSRLIPRHQRLFTWCAGNPLAELKKARW